MALSVLTLALAADLFLPVAGKVRSATGREFRTTVWITNASQRPATVRVTFLERHPAPAPSTLMIPVAAGATKEVDDLPLQLHRPGVVGALRFESGEPIAVSAWIFSGAAIGEGLHAVDAAAGLNHGDEGFIAGVQASADIHETTYFVETSGRPAGVLVTLRDSSGRTIAHDSFLLEAFEHRALPIAEFAGNTSVRSGSISVRATGGSGRVYAIGFQIPSQTGDGYFLEMTGPGSRSDETSTTEILLYSLTALAVIAAVAFDVYNRKRAKRG
jgi:hypothetical protein